MEYTLTHNWKINTCLTVEKDNLHTPNIICSQLKFL